MAVSVSTLGESSNLCINASSLEVHDLVLLELLMRVLIGNVAIVRINCTTQSIGHNTVVVPPHTIAINTLCDHASSRHLPQL